MCSDTKYGVCGVMASISVSVDGQQITVEAGGECGEGCTWGKLKAEFKMRDSSTQQWEDIFSYNGTNKTWIDDASTSGYDRFKAWARSKDTKGAQIHFVATDWVEGEI